MLTSTSTTRLPENATFCAETCMSRYLIGSAYYDRFYFILISALC